VVCGICWLVTDVPVPVSGCAPDMVVWKVILRYSDGKNGPPVGCKICNAGEDIVIQ
jgi:hypothetical protein